MWNISDFDSLYEARRHRRLQQNYTWDACIRHVEKNENMDEDYRAHVLFLLNTATSQSQMHETRKRGREDVIAVDDEEDGNSEYDQQYEHFFGALEKFGKSYVLKDNINGKPVFVKYEGASKKADESKPVSGRNKRDINQIYRLTNQKHGLENDLAVKKQKACGLQSQLGKKGGSLNQRRLVNPIEKENVIKLQNEPSNKKPDCPNNKLSKNLHGHVLQSGSSVGILCKNPGLRNNMVTTKLCQRDSQVRSSKKENGQIYFRKVSKTQNGINGKNVFPDLAEKDKVERPIFFKEVSRPGSVVKETKTGLENNYLAKNKFEDDVQARNGIKGFNIKSDPVKAAECSMFYERNGDENNRKNNNDDEHFLDVEILDSAEFFKANNLGPFVASKKIHENMGNGDDLQHLGNPSMHSDYRNKILNVLGKPFDKEEYKKLQKMVFIKNTQNLNEDSDEGGEGSCSRNKKSYLDYHADVKRKLKANQYNRQKRLNILRGFVFWLEHLTKEGAFKPWLDRECLAVEQKFQ